MNTTQGRLLLITQPDSYRIAPYLNAARDMGIEVMIASRGEFSLVCEVHKGLHIDLNDLQSGYEKIIFVASQTPFDGILGCDDSTVELAAKVARKLGLAHNSPISTRFTYRKDLARERLAQSHCSVPAYFVVNLDSLIDVQITALPYPCVIKPLNMSASRGVIRVNNAQQFMRACKRIKAIIASSPSVFERTHILVEQYIDGIEVAYEGYLHNNKLNTLALFDKPDPLTGPYFAETIYVTPSRLNSKWQKLIKKRVAEAVNAYGLSTGPIHAELRIDSQDAWILEVACRSIGGDCARVLDNGLGFNLEKLVIALAMRKPIHLTQTKEARGVMMIPIKEAGLLKRVAGLSVARQVKCIEKVDIIVREGYELIPLPEGNQYLGYIFAKGSSAEQVTTALRASYAHLRFSVAPVFDMNML